ncbi:MAG: STAS domain-containing protein [Trebonia sp.]
MHFTDPRELGGLHVIGSNDVAPGAVDDIYTDSRSGYPRRAAIHSGTFGLRSVPPGVRTVITLRDGLDFTAAPALRERLIDVLRRRIDLLILDLSHVTSCDVAGLAVLIGIQRRAGLLGIAMRLVAPSPPVGKALRATGLNRNFTIYPDLSGALAPERHEPATSATASARAVGEPAPGLLACPPPLSA